MKTRLLLATASAFGVMMLVGGLVAAQTGVPPISARGANQTVPPFVASKERSADGTVSGRATNAIVRGKVRAIDGATIVLDGPRGVRPVSVRETATAPTAPDHVRLVTDANTKFYVPGLANPTLSDVHVGDNIMALVKRASGQTLAVEVSVLPKPEHVLLFGEVKDLTSSSFKLNPVGNNAGELTVNLVASTSIVVPGQASGALANGNRVAVRAKPLSDGVVEAEVVLVNPTDRENALVGTVASVNGASLVVWTARGDSVIVDATSAVFARPNESLSDIHIGMVLHVYGIWNADKTQMTAQLIGDFPHDPR